MDMENFLITLSIEMIRNVSHSTSEHTIAWSGEIFPSFVSIAHLIYDWTLDPTVNIRKYSRHPKLE